MSLVSDWHDQDNQQVFQPPSATGARRTFELRPFTVADVLDGTFAIYKSNWKEIGLASLLYALPVGVLSALMNVAQGVRAEDSASFIQFFALGQLLMPIDESSLSSARLVLFVACVVLTYVVAIVFQPLVEAAIVRKVAATFVGTEMTIKEAFRGARRVWWPLVGASLLVALITNLGILLFLIGYVVFAVLFSVYIACIAIEEDGAFNGMGRSWALMKRRFFGYLAIRACVLVIKVFVTAAVTAIPVVLAVLFFAANLDALGYLAGGLGMVLVSVVTFPISVIATTIMYIDARVRFEGFDVQLMAARLPRPQPANDGSGYV